MIAKIRQYKNDRYGDRIYELVDFEYWLFNAINKDFLEEKTDILIETVCKLMSKFVELKLLTIKEVIEIVGDYNAEEHFAGTREPE